MASPLSPNTPGQSNPLPDHRVEVSLENGVVVYKADGLSQSVLREMTQSSSSVSTAIITLAKRDSSLKRLCENPNFKTALKVAVVAAIVIASAALAFTPVGLFAAVTIGVVGLALYALFESRAYGPNHFVKSHKIQVQQALLAQKIEGARAQLIENPTPNKIATLLSKTSSIEEIQIILEAAKKIPQLRSDTISKFASMITSATSPLDPEKVKKFLVRYFINQEKIHNLKKIDFNHTANPRRLPNFDMLRDQFRLLMEQFSKKYSSEKNDAYLNFTMAVRKISESNNISLDNVILSEEEFENLKAQIDEIRAQPCNLIQTEIEQIRKIQSIFNRSAEVTTSKKLKKIPFSIELPLTIGELINLKSYIEYYGSTLTQKEIARDIPGLMKRGLEIINNHLAGTKDELEGLNLRVEKELVARTLQPAITHLERMGAEIYQERKNHKLHLKENTLLAPAIEDTFHSTPDEAQALEDALYTDIRSLLDMPNFAPYREELLRAYPPRGA